MSEGEKMAKTYFWLKIQEEFYRQKEIKILRQMEKGSVYIIIYQKMLVYSLKNGNKLFYDHLKDSFEEEIALILDEEVEDVKTTVAFLKRAGLLDCVSDDEYVLTQVEELTGSENESTKRVKKHRENKKKAQEEKIDDEKCDKENVEENADEKINHDKKIEEKFDKKKRDDKSVTQVSVDKKKCDEKVNNKKKSSKIGCNKNETDCNENVTLDIEKDIDKELEKDIDKKIELQDKSFTKNIGDENHECVSFCVDENLSKITSLYEKNMGPVYPAGREYFINISKKLHWTLFKKAIEICIDKNNMTPAYLKGIIKKWDDSKIYTLENLQDREKEYASKNKVKNYSSKNNSYEKIDENMVREMEDLERKLGVS